MISHAIHSLLSYAQQKELMPKEDIPWLKNRLLALFELNALEDSTQPLMEDLPQILSVLTEYAADNGLLLQDSPTGRDLFDTKVMGELTPAPSTVNRQFQKLLQSSPVEATDWFYALCQNVNYIRTDRIAKDVKWVTETPYGDLDITINLSKPEKDPKAIAAARNLPVTAYPNCQLCRENEGYAGRLDFPARQNLRMIPLSLCGEDWFLQYSPYVYYNEHCIVLNGTHKPMKIHRPVFHTLLEFVAQFPHYFVGSNADLPIVGGSILAHEHFQGGHYSFAMERAEISTPVEFAGFPTVSAGILNWPISVLRLQSTDREALVSLADKILLTWREYSDPALEILSHTGDTPHNTITPIARMRTSGQSGDGKFELDLVLRNNRTTDEHPLGLFHPHAELHNIKKENIGLIEVMGLAVLPSRLKEELSVLAQLLADHQDPAGDPRTEKHKDWAEEILTRRQASTAEEWSVILQEEVGHTFCKVLEHAGVFKQDPQGQDGLLRFIAQVNRQA